MNMPSEPPRNYDTLCASIALSVFLIALMVFCGGIYGFVQLLRSMASLLGSAS